MASMRIRLKFDPGVIMYLIVIEKMIDKYRDVMRARPTERFQAMVHDLVMNHVLDGQEPAEEIRTAVMNVADDVMAGRDVTLRAGDYIALMNYAKAKKMI